jgi:hypothetical protein
MTLKFEPIEPTTEYNNVKQPTKPGAPFNNHFLWFTQGHQFNGKAAQPKNHRIGGEGKKPLKIFQRFDDFFQYSFAFGWLFYTFVVSESLAHYT